ncbi:MAG: methyltransferase [Clostridia bacterium]
MEHYYSKTPQSNSRTEAYEWELRGQSFRFQTDAGVFSKGKMDFGSGFLIQSILDEVEREPLKILDIGCGYGGIGIVLARFFPNAIVHMTDVNERALALCTQNIGWNRVKNVICYASDLFENITEQFDVIVSNPPIRAGKAVVYRLFEDASQALTADGSFYCVIQKKQGAESAQRKLADIFMHCECLDKKAGFRILKVQKTL